MYSMQLLAIWQVQLLAWHQACGIIPLARVSQFSTHTHIQSPSATLLAQIRTSLRLVGTGSNLILPHDQLPEHVCLRGSASGCCATHCEQAVWSKQIPCNWKKITRQCSFCRHLVPHGEFSQLKARECPLIRPTPGSSGIRECRKNHQADSCVDTL
jgi:hypothetical protein